MKKLTLVNFPELTEQLNTFHFTRRETDFSIILRNHYILSLNRTQFHILLPSYIRSYASEPIQYMKSSPNVVFGQNGEDKVINFSFSRFLKRKNLLNPNRSQEVAFVAQYEAINSESYMLFLQFGLVITLAIVFRNLYKDFGKDILVIFVELIQLIGIIDDDEWIKDELRLTPTRKSYRPIRRVRKTLREIVGIEKMITQVSEIVWFLRSKNQKVLSWFPAMQSLTAQIPNFVNPTLVYPKSYLFLGPPGTGKTVLVQAIAGEAGVPILVQSGSILKNPRHYGTGARSLQALFKRARQLTPCIVFIDEIDGLASRRDNMFLHVSDHYDLLDLIDHKLTDTSSLDLPSIYIPEDEEDEDFDILNPVKSRKISLGVLQETEYHNMSRMDQLSILTQLLIELDGLRILNNVITIGATNRIDMLDPAVLRPGRFNNYIYIDLPNYEKRVNLFKLATKPLGTEDNISWSYFSSRTEGLSAAAISSIVNESALIAIRNNHTHTVNTLETGIDRVRNLQKSDFSRVLYNEEQQIANIYSQIYQPIMSEKRKGIIDFQKRIPQIFDFEMRRNYQLHLQQLDYSIGQNIFSTLFKDAPRVAFLSAYEQTPVFQSKKQKNILDILGSKLYTRLNLETKLSFFLSGKAAQMVVNAIPYNQMYHLTADSKRLIHQLNEASTTGLEDFYQATVLVKYMIGKWYLYAEQVITEKYHQNQCDYNSAEFDVDELRLVSAIAEEFNLELNRTNRVKNLYQKWFYRAWWQTQIQQQMNCVNRGQMDWYRIYMSDPDQSEQNIEWVPPDTFYKATKLEQFNPYWTWNTVLLSTQHYLYESLVLNAFNLPFKVLKNSTELMDLLLDVLLRKSKIRNSELLKIVRTFYEFQLSSSDSQKLQDQIQSMDQDPIIVRYSWGKNSRMKNSKKIFMDQINELKSKMNEN